MAIIDKVNLKENGRFVISYQINDWENTAILIRDDGNCIFRQIRKIENCTFIDELEEFGNSKIVYGYLDREHNQFVLEKFVVKPDSCEVLNLSSRKTKETGFWIRAGVYLYQTLSQKEYLYTAWDKELSLKSFGEYNKFSGLNFEFFDEILQRENDICDIIGLNLYIGNEEKIKTMLKLPTEPYGNFQVSKYFYSYMENKEYELPIMDKFILPDTFTDLIFNNTNLFKKAELKRIERKNNDLNVSKTLIKKVKKR